MTPGELRARFRKEKGIKRGPMCDVQAKYIYWLESQIIELLKDHNELLETHEATKQQNVDVHDEWKELKKENEELKRLMYVDSDECRYDHTGWCQTHNMENYHGKCLMIRIRELLKTNKK